MPKEEKPLEEWFGLEKRKVKEALGDLKEFCPDIEILPEYERAKKLFEFLKPNIKMPKKPEEQDRWAREGKWILPKNVRGYVEDSLTLETLIGTGWGNCYFLSILYAILAQHIGLKAKVLLLHKHVANRVYLKGKTVLVDITIEIFDKKPQSEYKSCDSEFHYDSGYEAGWEFLANLTKAIELTKEAEKETSESRKKYLLDSVLKLYDACIKIKPNFAGAWYNKGNAYYSKGEYDLAIQCYEKAIEINPNYAEAWNNKGNAYGDKGEYDLAIKCYEKAIEINPNYAEALANKGVAYYSKGEYDIAIKCYERALRLFRKHGKERYAQIIEERLRMLRRKHLG